VDYSLNKKPLSTEIDFWRRDARTSRILKVRNVVMREKCKKDKQFWKEWKITR
jgi:hypothetical protein